MKRYLKSAVLIASCSLLGSCADHRVDRPDDEAMMIYRECMADMPTAAASADISGAISNAPVANENTSIAANARSRQEQNREIFCMQQAGWKK